MNHDELAALVRRRLGERAPDSVAAPGVRRAAVLAPFVFKGDRPHVLFTQRSMDVSTHKGQVSFPGGGIDPGDASPLAAALRETEEEIGVPARQIEVLGQIDDVATNAGTYIITPFAAILEDGAAHISSDYEVARILEVPLAYLMDAAQRQPDLKTHHWQYVWQGIVIWGATARMLNQLLHILGLQDPFEEDVRVLRALTDPDDRVRFIELLLELHPRRDSAVEHLRRHPESANDRLRALALG